MDLGTLVVALLALQGVLGGVDTVLNHELIVKLPRRAEARGEIGLHSIREAIYACLFGGLAEPLRPWLSPPVRRTITDPKADALDGAILLARMAHQGRRP